MSLIQNGNYYRLSDPFVDPYAAWMFGTEDRRQILLNVVMLEMHGNMTICYVELNGLIRMQYIRIQIQENAIMAVLLWRRGFLCRHKWESICHIR